MAEQSLEAISVLDELCDAVQRAVDAARVEAQRETFPNGPPTELVVARIYRVKVEIRRERNHRTPHLHVTHSDKIDVSIRLTDFAVLAGNIDGKTYRHLRREFAPYLVSLKTIWRELNVNNDRVAAEKEISSLPFSR